MKNEQPEIKNLSERVVACVSFTGNYVGKPEVFANLFNQLCGWAGPKGMLTPEAVYLSSYVDDPKNTPADELQLVVCMGIPEDTDAEGGVQKKVLPGGRYAVMHCELTGAQEYGPAWEEIVVWADKNGYNMDLSRPSYEIYLNNPEEHPQKHHTLDICLSVKE